MLITGIVSAVAPVALLAIFRFTYYLIRAPVELAANEERQKSEERIGQLQAELERVRETEIVARNAHTEAVREQTKEIARSRQSEEARETRQRLRETLLEHRAQFLAAPKVKIALECTSEHAALIITNEGASAECWATFTAHGPVQGNSGQGVFCRWEDDRTKKVLIPTGMERRILLAELISGGGGVFRWKIWRTGMDELGNEVPMFMMAHYSSHAMSEPIARAPDIEIKGFVVGVASQATSLDATSKEGFHVVLGPFSARAAST